jgi:excisionase family DNA binding protein
MAGPGFSDEKKALGYSERDRLLTVPEAADYLRMSSGGLYHLISQRRIPVVRISARCVRLSQRALLVWIENLSQEPEQSPCGRNRAVSKRPGIAQKEVRDKEVK